MATLSLVSLGPLKSTFPHIVADVAAEYEMVGAGSGAARVGGRGCGRDEDEEVDGSR